MGIFSGSLFRRGLSLEGISVAFKNGLLVGLEIKNSQQHKDNSLKKLKTANPKSPWPYVREGLLSGSFFVLFLFLFLSLFFFCGGGVGGGGGGGGRDLLSEFYGMLFSMGNGLLWEVIPAFRNPG